MAPYPTPRQGAVKWSGKYWLLTQSPILFLTYFYFLKDLSIYYVYSIPPASMPAGQKRAPTLIIDGCESPCGCWELNSVPLEEQPVLLTSEPSLQSGCSRFFFHSEVCFPELCVCVHGSEDWALGLLHLKHMLYHWTTLLNSFGMLGEYCSQSFFTLCFVHICI